MGTEVDEPMIIQNPKTKQQLLQFIQSLKTPQFAYVDVLSKDDKQQVLKEFDAKVRQGPFTVLFIRDWSMKDFHQFRAELQEGTYPLWVKGTVGLMILRVRSLASRIEREADPNRQNSLIAQQNKLISYINGLGIAVSTSDRQLLQKIKQIRWYNWNFNLPSTHHLCRPWCVLGLAILPPYSLALTRMSVEHAVHY